MLFRFELMWFFIACASVLISWLGVALFRPWSERRRLLDFPNERSSHESPTPRGGGLVIVVTCLVFFLVLSLLRPAFFSWSYLGGASLIAIISWLDDLYGVSFIWRLLIHVGAALIIIVELGSFGLSVSGEQTSGVLNLVGGAVTLLWIVWVINAYNFMDGIDGIAGLQGLIAGLGWSAVGYLLGFSTLSFYFAVVAGVSIGFLIHNWPPAKIFMGDVGSAFLGFTFAVAPLFAAREQIETAGGMPIVAVMFLWFFLLDTVLTFLRRLIRGKQVWTAHREHIYQRLVISGKSHSFVTLLYGILACMIAILALFLAYPTRTLSFWSIFIVAGVSALLLIYSRPKKELT